MSESIAGVALWELAIYAAFVFVCLALVVGFVVDMVLSIPPVRSRLERRRRAREDEAFWAGVRSRRREVSARLAEWDEAEALARQEYLREQEKLASEMVPVMQAEGSWWSAFSKEDRVELGLEVSPPEKDRLQSLMPFLATPRPASSDTSTSGHDDRA